MDAGESETDVETPSADGESAAEETTADAATATSEPTPAKTPVGSREARRGGRHRFARSRLKAESAAAAEAPAETDAPAETSVEAPAEVSAPVPADTVDTPAEVPEKPAAEAAEVSAAEAPTVAVPVTKPAEQPEQPEATDDPDAGTEDVVAEPESSVPESAPAAAKKKRWFRRKPAAAPVVDEPEVAAAPETSEETAPEDVSGDVAEEPATEEPAAEEIAEDDAPEKVSLVKAPAVDEAAADDEPAAAPKPAGRPLYAAVAAAAVLFVGAAGFAGALVEPVLADQAQVDTKLHVAATAKNAITTLWTYTPENMETLPDRASGYLAGDFEERFRKYVDAIAPTNKQAQVTNTTEVTGAAIESLNGGEATAIIYTNSRFSSPRTNNVESLRYQSYRVVLQRQDSQWKITDMVPITQLDVTPKLGG